VSRLLLVRNSRRGALAALAVVLAAGACNYGFQAGAALNIRTLAVVPFENDTDRLELTQEIHAVLLRELPRSLGARPAGEEGADAVVRGTITRYDVTAPSYRSDASGGGRPEVLQRQVMMAISVQIVDLRENLVLWEETSVLGQGEYLEATETEDDGRRVAIEQLVQKIVDGAQSTW
jgi:curli biogenesis system outer membrane secretion channel CsgG